MPKTFVAGVAKLLTKYFGIVPSSLTLPNWYDSWLKILRAGRQSLFCGPDDVEPADVVPAPERHDGGVAAAVEVRDDGPPRPLLTGYDGDRRPSFAAPCRT